MISEEQLKKLPQWAQSAFRQVEDALETQKQELAMWRGDKPSRVGLATSNLKPQPIPEAPVVFQLEGVAGCPGAWETIQVKIDHDAQGVAFLDVNGSQGIAIRPRASNHVEIAFVGR